MTLATSARTSRRTFLAAGGGLAFSSAAGAPALAASGTARAVRRRAYVLVVDGCRPDEIDPVLTPHLHALRRGGLHFPHASSLPVMETIPNHVMMMTGVRPDRSGVPANAVYDRALGAVRTMDRARDLRTDTVLGRLARHGLSSGTVLSKQYLYGVFGTLATHRWEPAPVVPVSGHAPDAFTMDAALEMVQRFDPHLVFVNLGDIDRFGHSDVTGPLDVRAARRLALADSDRQVQRFTDLLLSSGRWEHSLLVVLADHSMDWSTPDAIVSLQDPLTADPFLAGRFAIADNGGADLVYWTGPDAQRAEAVERIRAIARGVPGVLDAHPRTRASLRLGPEAGDVVAWCEPGWRFSDPDPTSNPIPGNHGHPATKPIPFFLTGGHPRVPRGARSTARAHTVDVAPTVASFFGLGAPAGGWDGRARL